MSIPRISYLKFIKLLTVSIDETQSHITIKQTNSEDSDFITMVALLDKDLLSRYGEQQAFFDQFNKLNVIKHTVVAYVNNAPVGCAAMKAFDEESIELKRMFVKEEYRGKGIASKLLVAIEQWAAELGFKYCVLETANRQPEAIRFYHRSGYTDIDRFGPYVGVEASMCMRKRMRL